jgi:predicted GIY-YIG superfamily endonuclease
LVVGSNPTAGAISMFWVYILQNPDGKLYIGQTDDLQRRLLQHNDPAHTLTRTTKRFRGPWKVIYAEELCLVPLDSTGRKL